MQHDDDELTYWRHRTPVGVKVEEISGGSRYSEKLWPLMARQVWGENGRDGEYRSIVHLPDGAPLLDGTDQRISLSHTRGMLVVATLPPTPEADLTTFSPRAAMGVDTERVGREIPAVVRTRFLSDEEQELIPDENTLLAWTCKEALYKAVLGQAKSWAECYRILCLPDLQTGAFGQAEVRLDGTDEPFVLYSYLSDGFIVTLALSTRCATYKKAAEGK